MSEKITLAHGGGGKMSARLIETEILSRFASPELAALPDAATLPFGGGKLVFSTDSFVVAPRFFPGGNIGELAVYGTTNDILVAGGVPKYLSLGLILEEGFELAELRRILDAARDAALACEVEIVTGDTKVVPRGQADGLYINTSGIGLARPEFKLGGARIEHGDVVLVSGTLGDHGFAVMAARHGIAGALKSDCGTLRNLCHRAAACGDRIKFMRDPTRGGLAAVLNEIAAGRPFGIELEDAALPLAEPVRALAEILGIDPCSAASEGRLVLVASPEAAPELLRNFRQLPEGRDAAIVGKINGDAGRVTRRMPNGARRPVELPTGELLPRIC